MTVSRAEEDAEWLDLLYSAGRGLRMVQPLWKMVQQCLIKLNIHLPYDPTVSVPGVYPRDEEHVYTAALARAFQYSIYWGFIQIDKNRK